MFERSHRDPGRPPLQFDLAGGLGIDVDGALGDNGQSLVEDARREDLADGLARRGGHVDTLAVDVVPAAAGEDGDVVGQVEDGGDECQTEEEEYDGVCRKNRVSNHSAQDRNGEEPVASGAEEDVQKANFSHGVNM